ASLHLPDAGTTPSTVKRTTAIHPQQPGWRVFVGNSNQAIFSSALSKPQQRQLKPTTHVRHRYITKCSEKRGCRLRLFRFTSQRPHLKRYPVRISHRTPPSRC